MAIEGGISVIGFISPTREDDKYPVTKPKYGLGGLRTVGSTADLYAIPSERREVGMIAFVVSDQKYWNLVGGIEDENWQLLELGSSQGGATGATGLNGTGYTGISLRDNYLYVTPLLPDGTTGDEINLGYIGPSGNSFVFETDLTADFGEDGRFGKYQYGDLIRAAGKTAVEVIKEALVAVLPPVVQINVVTPASIDYGQTAISNVLSYSYEIKTQGAGLSSQKIYWKNNFTDWEELDLLPPPIVHTYVVEENQRFGVTYFQYKYEVIDTQGGSATSTDTITYSPYDSPTITFNQYAPNSSGIPNESVIQREKGNTATKLAGSNSSSNITVTSNETYVDLVNWNIQYADNSSLDNWTSLTSGSFDTGAPTPPTTFTHSPSSVTSNKIRYRLVVEDESSNTTTQTLNTINFYGAIFYGATSSVPSSSSEIRNLSSKRFVNDSNPFILNTGTEGYTNFVVAFPDEIVTETIFDKSSLNAPLLSEYVLDSGLTQVPNYSGNLRNYNVYINTIDSPYTDGNHEHEITFMGNDVS